MNIDTQQRPPRRRTRAAALLAVLVVAAVTVLATLVGAPAPASAGEDSPSSRVADLALPYVGQHAGECWPFVRNMILAAGGRNISTSTSSPDYFAHLRAAGGVPVGQGQLARGDVVQFGQGIHTLIIVGRITATRFTVVDANHDYKGTVMTYPRDVTLGSAVQAFRFGQGGGTPPPPPPPPSAKEFSVMNTSEQPPDGVWFRDNPNLPGPRLNGLGVYAGARVRLSCYGTGPAMGPGANRVWYQVANLTRPSAPGRSNTGWLNAHFVDDGLGPNQVTAGVPVC